MLTPEERRVRQRLADKKYYDAHREVVNAKGRARYYANWEHYNAVRRANRLAHPEREKAVARNNHYKKLYGLTLEEYNELLLAQGGVCVICGGKPDGWELAVDHDHQTGKIRGLVCHACNLGLGKFCEDPSLLRKAADYIETNRGEQ